jgi:hypothetical protein
VKIRVHPWQKNTPHPCSSVAKNHRSALVPTARDWSAAAGWDTIRSP